MPIKKLTKEIDSHWLKKVFSIGTLRGGGPRKQIMDNGKPRMKDGQPVMGFGDPLDHFRFVPSRPDYGDVVAAVLNGNPQPKEYTREQGVAVRRPMIIFFLTPDKDEAFDAWYTVRNSAGHTTHQCDGEFVVKDLINGEVKEFSLDEQVPCQLDCANDPRDDKGRRKAGATTASLTFACAQVWNGTQEVPGIKGHTMTMRLTGKNSIGTIASGLKTGCDILEMVGMPLNKALWELWGEWKQVGTPEHGKKWALVANIKLIYTPQIENLLLEGMQDTFEAYAYPLVAIPARIDTKTGEIPQLPPPKTDVPTTNQKSFHAAGVALMGSGDAWDKYRPHFVAGLLNETYTSEGDFSANRLTQKQVDGATKTLNKVLNTVSELPENFAKHLNIRLFLPLDYSEAYATNLFTAHSKINVTKACKCALDNPQDVTAALMAYDMALHPNPEAEYPLGVDDPSSVGF